MTSTPMSLWVNKCWKHALTVLFGAAIFLFWWLVYPHALSYQEQYQLFLWTGDYLYDSLRIPGGLSAWLGEMVVQFHIIPWLGALFLGILFVALQCAVAVAMPKDQGRKWYLLSLLSPVMVLALMGDESVLLSYLISLTITVALSAALRDVSPWVDLLVVPLTYWVAGPMAWLYVILCVLGKGWRCLGLALFLALAQWLAYKFLLPQWTLYDVVTGRVYYRIPMMTPTLMWVIPLVVVAIVWLSRLRHAKWMVCVEAAVLLTAAYLAVEQGYEKEKYELIRQDYLVRSEQWDKVIEEASKGQVRTSFSSVCVNLALAKKRQLADRMFDFYQSGQDALIMPRSRDLTSMLPSAEAFWHLGMVNSAQRYMFDTQESILNAKKSGRCTKRIAECMIVNGHYKPAAKQLDLLKKSLFYRKWAKDAETYLNHDDKVNSHPVWGKKRQIRFKQDFLYSYAEMDKMLGQLFIDNPDNKMALDYMLAQLLLNGNVPAFSQYIQWAQQYGGYSSMPLVYQDVVRCIQNNGRVEGSPYMNYLKRVRKEQ